MQTDAPQRSGAHVHRKVRLSFCSEGFPPWDAPVFRSGPSKIFPSRSALIFGRKQSTLRQDRHGFGGEGQLPRAQGGRHEGGIQRRRPSRHELQTIGHLVGVLCPRLFIHAASVTADASGTAIFQTVGSRNSQLLSLGSGAQHTPNLPNRRASCRRWRPAGWQVVVAETKCPFFPPVAKRHDVDGDAPSVQAAVATRLELPGKQPLDLRRDPKQPRGLFCPRQDEGRASGLLWGGEVAGGAFGSAQRSRSREIHADPWPPRIILGEHRSAQMRSSVATAVSARPQQLGSRNGETREKTPMRLKTLILRPLAERACNQRRSARRDPCTDPFRRSCRVTVVPDFGRATDFGGLVVKLQG